MDKKDFFCKGERRGNVAYLVGNDWGNVLVKNPFLDIIVSHNV